MGWTEIYAIYMEAKTDVRWSIGCGRRGCDGRNDIRKARKYIRISIFQLVHVATGVDWLIFVSPSKWYWTLKAPHTANFTYFWTELQCFVELLIYDFSVIIWDSCHKSLLLVWHQPSIWMTGGGRRFMAVKANLSLVLLFHPFLV